MNGILPLWKPRGMTSHDCVMIVRRLFGTRKVGHTGTLDPEVEGVLAICLGQATKVVPYVTDIAKVYEAECTLGISTETEDAHGKVVEEVTVTSPPTDEEIEEALTLFRGEITQTPPMYSAVRVDGKRLYEYARANEYVERPTRKVTIHELVRLPDKAKGNKQFNLRIACSSGTYIRTLCVDLGKTLGYPAHMSDLTRTEAGSFTADQTVTFEEIEAAKKENKHLDLLVPMVKPLSYMQHYHVSDDLKFRVSNGQKLKKPDEITESPFLMMSGDQLLAIYQTHPDDENVIKPVRVFNY